MQAGYATVGVRRLLPGEVPESQTLDEIRHWHAVYAELWAGCLEIASGLGPEDQALLLERAERFRAGLEFWTQRRRDYFRDGGQPLLVS